MIRDCLINKNLILETLKRDKYTCQICGQIGGKLEVDHIKEFSVILDEFLKYYYYLDISKDKFFLFQLSQKYLPFWDKNNLRVLCKKCNFNKEINRRKTIENFYAKRKRHCEKD